MVKQAEYQMRSTDRVVAVLTGLGQGPVRTISQLSAEVRLPRPTVLRLLDSLAGHGFVERDGDAGYRLGQRLVRLVMEGRGLIDLKSAAHPAMQRLAELTDETVTLQVIVESCRMCIDQIESVHEFRRVLPLNKPRTLHGGASAKVLLAWLPESRVIELVGNEPFHDLTGNSDRNVAQLLVELREVRKMGYAISLGEVVGAGNAIAAPILSSNDEVLGAVAVVGPAGRLTEEMLHGWEPSVRQAARDIAIAYGGLAPIGTRSPGGG